MKATALISLWLIAVPAAWGSTAQLAGRVLDTMGAAIPGASLVITSTETGRQRHTSSNEAGHYGVPMLPPGEYRILVSKEGFRPASHPNLKLEVDQIAEIDFVLRVGAVTEEIQVTDAAPVLSTSEASQSQVIRSRRMVDMPLNGRDYIQLALLSAGALDHLNGRVKGFSAAGQRTTQNNYTIDGIDNNSLQIAAQVRRGEVIKPPVDAIREFRISTNAYSVTTGRGLGGNVNISIRSGSNHLHGTAYHFLRNEALDAKNFFDPAEKPKPPFKRNQFGFAAGGPVARNRTFFFGDLEETLVRESATYNQTIPTPEQLAGDFSNTPQAIHDPATFNGQTGLRQPFAGNVIPAARIDPVARAASAWYPAPNRPGLTQNFLYNSPDREDVRKWDARIDHRFTESDNVFVRYSHQNDAVPGALALPSGLDGDGTDFRHRGRNLGAVWNHVFSVNLIANVKLGWNHVASRRDAVIRQNLNGAIGLRGVDQNLPGAALFSIAGLRNLGTSSTTPNRVGSETRQLDADLALLRRAHTLKFGYSILFLRSDLSNPQQALGRFEFNGNFTRQTALLPNQDRGGRPIADFMLGIPVKTDISDAARMSLRSPWNAFYFEDQWKASTKLTVTAGVRYDLALPWVDAGNGLANFDIDTNPATPSLVLARPGNWADRATVQPDRNNFAPRIGFAYRAAEHTVIRAGYGLFYALFEPTGGAQFLETNPPFHWKSQISTDSIHPAVLLRDGVPPVIGDPAYAAALSLSSFERDPPWPLAQQWNFNIQHSLPGDTVWEAGYYGAKSNHLVNRINANWALPGPGDINSRRRYQEVAVPGSGAVVSPLAAMNRHEYNGNSLFHSLQTRLERKYANGLTLLAAYIFSRTIGDAPGFAGSGSSPNSNIQNPRDRRAERSLDGLHRKHSFVVSYIYDLPLGREGDGWRRRLLAGWSVAGITVVASGRPYGLSVRGDPANTGDLNRPNVVGEPHLGATERTLDRYFNTSAFAPNNEHEFGNAGRNVLIGPGVVNFDFALYKRIVVDETRSVQFRCEAFNATNTPAFGFPNAEVGNSSFGRITSAGRPRNLQFGLKLVFGRAEISFGGRRNRSEATRRSAVEADGMEGQQTRRLVMNRLGWGTLLGLILLLTLTTGIFAQTETARITGTINDGTGAVIPGATITFVHLGTNTNTSVSTNEVGRYVSIPLRIGEYRVEVEADGFKRAIRSGVVLQLNETALLDISLELGAVSEVVDVTADAPLLETTQATQGQVIDNTRIVDMPLNGRNYIQLALLSSGAIDPLGGRAGGFSAGGMRITENNYMLDGVDNNNVQIANQGRQAEAVRPPIDAIQEFKVSTNSFSAEYGRAMGGVVNVSVMSGTNDLHGTVFEFLRNEAFDAKNLFDPVDADKPPFKRNQYGLSVGGPVLLPKIYNGKDKTFFFFDYEGTRIRESRTTNPTIPTMAARAGDFSGINDIHDPFSYNGKTRQQFPGNVIPASVMDPIGVKVVNLYPKPTNNDVIRNYLSNPPSPLNLDKWDVRFDQNLTSNDTVYFRYSSQHENEPPSPSIPAPAFDSSDQSSIFDHNGRNMALVWNHVWSPTIVTSTRAGWNRMFTERNPPIDYNGASQLGIPGVNQTLAGLVPFSITGYQSIGTGNTNPNLADSQARQLVSDTTWTAGAHSVKAGLNITWLQSYLMNPQQELGNFQFTGNYTRNPQNNAGGDAIADLLLGTMTRALFSNSVYMNLRAPWYQFYVQDEWRVNQRLTMNIGVRYELNSHFVEKDNGISMPDLSQPGILTFILAKDGSRFDRALIKNDAKIVPRFGFAYRLGSSTVLRGGYGMFVANYTAPGGAQFLETNPPNHMKIQLSTDSKNVTLRLKDGVPGDALTPTRATSLVFSTYEREPNMPVAHQWNFNIQQELAKDWMLEVGYFGNKGNHLINRMDGNYALPGAGNINNRRIYTQAYWPGTDIIVKPLSQFYSHNWDGNTNFNSFQTKIEKRFSNGFSVLGSFIWSKTMGDVSGFAATGSTSNSGLQDPRNRKLEKSLADQHIGKRFVTSFIYDLPFGRGKQLGGGWNRLVDAVLGGWTTAGIISARSGRPGGLAVQGNPSNSSTFTRPNVVSGQTWYLPSDERSMAGWFNTAAFEAPPQYTYGNAGRNIIILPGAWNFDAAVYKKFRLMERLNLQFRFEAFNAFNHPNWGDPNLALGNKAFGTIGSASAPRNLQLGLKLIW